MTLWILKDENGVVEGAGAAPSGAKVYECEEAWARDVEAAHFAQVKGEQDGEIYGQEEKEERKPRKAQGRSWRKSNR